MQSNHSLDSVTDSVAFLNEQVWHDSILHEIRLIRTRSADRVLITMDLLVDWEKQVSRRVEISFNGCRSVSAEMHWGVLCMSAGEMIETAESSVSGDLVEQVRKTWQKMGGSPTLDVGQFQMKLASTGSVLRIVFERISVQFLGVELEHDAPPPLGPLHE